MDQVDQRKAFKYPALKNPRQIRLIEVHPAESFYDPIEVSFVITELDRPDYYQTLSYTWGETFPDGSHLTDTIFCAECRLRVTSNLHSFLKQFRHEAISGDSSSRMPIWIDAISINQDDNFEREQQVAMMAQIYERSFQLIIWLGDAELPECAGWPFAQSWDAFVRDDILQPDSRERAVIEQMVHNPWFQRRWIIQEVMHTRKRTIWIGSKKIPWNNFCAVVERLEVVGSTSPLHNNHAASFLRDTNPMHSLLQNLFVWRHAECGDPRDRIYALLSISHEDSSFDVDYSIDAETLYYRIAKRIAQSESPGALEALLLSALLHRPHSNSRLPTWVPEWRNLEHIHSQHHYECIKRSLGKPHGKIALRTSQPAVNHQYLELRGWLIPQRNGILKRYEQHRPIAELSRDHVRTINCLMPWNTRMFVSFKLPVAAHELGRDAGVHQWCFSPSTNLVFGLSRAPTSETAKQESIYQLVTCLLLEDEFDLERLYREQCTHLTSILIA